MKTEQQVREKYKTYVLMVARQFPVKHYLAGELTEFKFKIEKGYKKHTIRMNYDLWNYRINEVNGDRACLSLRQWTGKPYNSKQVEIFNFCSNQVGIQKLQWDNLLGWFIDDFDSDLYTKDLAENDGLTHEDFKDWFKKYPAEPMAIIHFTKFRYTH